MYTCPLHGWHSDEFPCPSCQVITTESTVDFVVNPSPAPCQFCKGTQKITVHNTTAGPEFEEIDCPCCVGVTVNGASPAPGVVEQTDVTAMEFLSNTFNLHFLSCAEVDTLVTALELYAKGKVRQVQAVEPEKGLSATFKKYQSYVNNLEANIKNGSASSNRLSRACTQMECYKEILEDIKNHFPHSK